MMYEGEVTLGLPSGFGRKIDPRSKINFIGYLRNWNDTKQAPTLGLYFENFKLRYSGLYRGGSFFREEDDKNEKLVFKSFDYEVFKAQQWTIDTGYCVQSEGNTLPTWGTIIASEDDEDDCKEFCSYDPQCSAYEFHNDNK
jgi:hypothetical protein